MGLGLVWGSPLVVGCLVVVSGEGVWGKRFLLEELLCFCC